MIFKNEVETRWFIKVIGILLLLCIVYVWLHVSFKGKAVNQLSTSDVTNINLLFNNQPIGIIDTTNAGNFLTQGDTSRNPVRSNVKTLPVDSLKKMVLVYIFTKYPPLTREDSLNTANVLMQFDRSTFPVMVTQYPYLSGSFFWLTDGWIYLEIIFWSLFGLICSLLYNVSEAVRVENFKETEKPIHLAKLIYTPFIVLIIYLAADTLTSENSLSVPKYGTGVMVFAFILGFFSRRSIELLDRLKEIILPGKKDKDDQAERGSGEKTGKNQQSNEQLENS